MRIRTQLILAAFVLAVIPLAAIVTYSYHSSRRALEAAYRGEADRLTRQMDRRLATLRADLQQRMTVVSALPLPDRNAKTGDVNSIVTVMGDSASFVDALEFQPLDLDGQPAPGEPNEPPEPQVAEAETEIPEPEPADPAPPAPTPPPAGVVVGRPAPMPPPHPMHPVIIDLPPVAFPKYVMSEAQRELIAEVGKLAAQLTRQGVTPEEKEDIRKELHAAQTELRRIMDDERRHYQANVREAQDALRARQAAIDAARREHLQARIDAAKTAVKPATSPQPATTAGAVIASDTPAARPKSKAKPKPKAEKSPVRRATVNDLERAAVSARKSALILGQKFQTPVRSEGEVVGQLTARISPEQVVRRILGNATEDGSELAFAIDREGNVYTRTAEERSQLDALGIPQRLRKQQSVKGIDGWIVTTSTDPQSGLRIGVARPVGENLQELRRAAGRNFGLGVGLIAFALIGIVPLSNHLTRDVKLVTEGADRIAHGDLMTRLPVKTKNELGQLAKAFNRMAEDLSVNQQRLVEQERARKEQELQQRLMSVEYERKSVELEDARRFQLSMLPKEVPHHPSYDVAVFTKTATEVGGDYYDFHVDRDALSVTIGDATGHGAKAGTMVTVVKTLFSGYTGEVTPAEFLDDAAHKIKRMDLGRMAMALSLARFEKRKLTVSSAGMPPLLVHRLAEATVEEIALAATPLGTLGMEYPQTSVTLATGDTVLLMSDGFPELMNESGQQLGYTGALDAFVAAAREPNADGVIATLADTARRWHGENPPNDDVTFVVVRVM